MDKDSSTSSTTSKSQTEAFNDILAALDRSKGPRDKCWKKLLKWLDTHDEVSAAKLCSLRGRKGRTLLHVACSNNAPPFVIERLVSIAPESIALSWGNDDSTSSLQDHDEPRGRTPLHLAAQHGLNHESARRLVEPAAASSSRSVLSVQDSQGDTPLHVALSYSYSVGSAEMVQLLLEQGDEPKKIRNSDGKYPFRCFAKSLEGRTLTPQERRNALRCLDAYIESLHTYDEDHMPKIDDPDRRFFNALGGCPDWVIDHAALKTKVQVLVNSRFASLRITSILLFRFTCLFWIIVGMHTTWGAEMIEFDFINMETIHDAIVPWYVTATHLMMFMGFVGLWFDRWAMMTYWTMKGRYFARIQKHPSELVHIVVILGGLFYALHPYSRYISRDFESWAYGLQIVSAVAVGLAWCGVIVLVRLVSVGFSEITDGVQSAGQKITAFMVAFTMLIFAFAQMMFIAAQEPTSICEGSFCTFTDSLLKTYTFSVGEVDETAIPSNNLGTFLYVLFVYVVVILLTNVLAFIAGGDILKRDNTELGFWSSRIYYVAEMDALDHTLRSYLGCSPNLCRGYDNNLRNGWETIRSVFQDKGLDACSCAFLCVMLTRALVIMIMIIWILAGLLAFGVIWPPQVREYLLEASMKEEKQTTQEKEKELSSKEPCEGTEEGMVNLGDVERLEDKVGQLEDTIGKMEGKLEQVLLVLEKMEKSQP